MEAADPRRLRWVERKGRRGGKGEREGEGAASAADWRQQRPGGLTLVGADGSVRCPLESLGRDDVRVELANVSC
jgi:hypothetical protein